MTVSSFVTLSCFYLQNRTRMKMENLFVQFVVKKHRPSRISMYISECIQVKSRTHVTCVENSLLRKVT